MANGDAVLVGETRAGYNPTQVIGSNQDNGGDFVVPLGTFPAVFAAFPNQNPANSPSLDLAGLFGLGNSAGTGVQGIGGPNKGTGVLGIGSGQFLTGGERGGIGVKGIGGSGDGLADKGNPPPPGVMGVGGKGITSTGMVSYFCGSGVVGTCGDVLDVPKDDHLAQSGITGIANSGVGAAGVSQFNRGGVFATGLMPKAMDKLFQMKARARTTEQSAQIHLVPLENPDLPTFGIEGDLIAGKFRSANEVELWFCVEGDGFSPARWKRLAFA